MLFSLAVCIASDVSILFPFAVCVASDVSILLLFAVCVASDVSILFLFAVHQSRRSQEASLEVELHRRQTACTKGPQYWQV